MVKYRIIGIVLVWAAYLIFVTNSRSLMYSCMYAFMGSGVGLEGVALYKYIENAVSFYYYWYTIPMWIAGIFTIWCVWGIFKK